MINAALQLVDISKLGLNSKIKKFSYSFIGGKGYSPPSGGIAFCLQAEARVARPLSEFVQKFECAHLLYGKELTDNNKCGLIWFVGNEKPTIA